MVIGILGGTFDPIHSGHLALAQHAVSALPLNKLVFLPAGIPPHKAQPHTSAEHRLAMLQLCVQELQQCIPDKPDTFSIDTRDLINPFPCYSYQSIESIKNAYTPNTSLVWLLGWDSWLTLPTWQHPERIIQNVNLAVFLREAEASNSALPEDTKQNKPNSFDNSNTSSLSTTNTIHIPTQLKQLTLTTTPQKLSKTPAGTVFFDKTFSFKASSTLIRHLLATNRKEAYKILPPKIQHYIDKYHLYEV